MYPRLFVQDNGDGTFSLVEEYAAGGFTTRGTGTQQEMEQRYNSLMATGAFDAMGEVAPATTTTPTGGTYQTREGPKTEAQLRTELSAAGYGGPWDINSMLTAYEQAGGGAAGGAEPGYPLLPAQFRYEVELAIAELEAQVDRAQLALDERRFEELDLALLDLERAEFALNEQLATAGITGYMEGKPTLEREQWEATQAFQQQQLTEQIRQFDEQAALAREQAEAAIRQGDERLALERQSLAQQYQLQSQQLQQQLAQITGVYAGAPTLEAQQLQEQIRQFDEQAALARQQAEAAIRQGDEQLALQAQAQAQQYELRSQELRQQAAQFEQGLTLQQAQLQEQIRQFNTQAEFARWEAERAFQQGDQRLALEQEQLAREYEYRAQQLQQQAGQFAQTFGLEEQRFQEAIRQADRDYTENVRRYGLEFAEGQRQFDIQAALAQRQIDLEQAGLIGYYEGVPTLERQLGQAQYTGWWGGTPGEGGIVGGIPTIEMAQLMGEPRNLAQSLILLGYSPEAAAAWLQQTPTVQNLMGYPGVSFPGGVTAEGRNPLFPFISGRQLPVRETLRAIEAGSPTIPLIESLASFSGQTPESFWGEFESYLPKGTRNPLTRFL